MDENNLKKLVSFFYEIGSMRKIPRAHQQTLFFRDLSDNIASHSFRVTMIGYFLANELDVDLNKVIKMCLFHDIEEARTGDQNWLHKKYVKAFEKEVREDQLTGLKNIEDLKKILDEYDQRQTPESRIAKDADLLDQIFLLREYEWQGSVEAKAWLRGHVDQNEQWKLLSTELARKIATEAMNQKPSDWWDSLWTSEKRK